MVWRAAWVVRLAALSQILACSYFYVTVNLSFNWILSKPIKIIRAVLLRSILKFEFLFVYYYNTGITVRK